MTEKNDDQYVISYDSNSFLSDLLKSEINTGGLSYCEYCTKNCAAAAAATDEKCTAICKLCDNETLHLKLKEMQTTHSGADSRYQDIQTFYNKEYLKMINLGVGILIQCYLLYKSI